MLSWTVLLISGAAAGRPLPEIRWRSGPSTAAIGPGAVLHVPEGMIHAGGEDMARFFEFTGNPPSGNELAIAGPASLDWFAVFSWRTYASLGFEASNPDPLEIAGSIRAGSAEANRERARQGRETLDVLEWTGEPVFDGNTGRLEFRLRTRESGGRQVENRFVYFLGRRGVVEVEFVSEAGTGQEGFERLLGLIEWKDGERHQRSAGTAPLAVTAMAALAAAAIWIRIRRQRGQ